MESIRKIFAYELQLEKDRIIATENICGAYRSIPLFVGSNRNKRDLAQACRIMAYGLLERADSLDHIGEFYHEQDIPDQICLMLEENKKAARRKI